MPDDLLANPRIAELLKAAHNAVTLRRDMQARREPDAEVVEALDTIYRDLGRALYTITHASAGVTMLPTDTETVSEPDTAGGYTDQIDADTSADLGERWYTDEVEIERPPEPLFDPGDLEDYTDIPESDPTPVDEEGLVTDAEEFSLLNAEQARARLETEGTAWAELKARESVWIHQLKDFLDLVEIPADFRSADELAVEASRVQWAASELPTRMQGIPAEIQSGVVALLGARAQHLRAHLDVDVGPRLALDRLRRFRVTAELLPVASLTAEPRAEYGSWENDVLQWWSVLSIAKQVTS